MGGIKKWVIGVMAGMVVVSAPGMGCGPKKRAPKEGDVSMVPADVLASFRRGQPNAVVLKARQVDKGNWELLVSSPRREKKTYLYTPQGDLLKKR